ncbi:MAG: hypothetical protein CFK52_02375 [Chloracidobacterium sp. CP2_5A]|nr:MAG: hypothetical protein CFK52_02375 [Chloracidobacterium sp. CP2_5A]
MTKPARQLKLTLAGCLAAGCVIAERQAAQIADAARPETLILRKKPSQGRVTGLDVAISGHLQGATPLQLIEDGKPGQERRLRGNIAVAWQSDWRADEAELRYHPDPQALGRIRIAYRFLSP